MEQVHKGDQASAAYLLLPTLSKEEQNRLRRNMLIYCGRDTFATVKLYEKLKENQLMIIVKLYSSVAKQLSLLKKWP